MDIIQTLTDTAHDIAHHSSAPDSLKNEALNLLECEQGSDEQTDRAGTFARAMAEEINHVYTK